MKKVLFLIHDLGEGGAEKVLVNLVNNMDTTAYNITVMALFGGGVNERFLSPNIRFKTVFKQNIRGNSHIMKLFTPEQLHKYCIDEHYDIEIAYLEGPAARIISGCQDKDTKKIAWIHCTMRSLKELSRAFRNEREAICRYQQFDKMVFVSEGVQKAFLKHCPNIHNPVVLYNTNESALIKEKAMMPLEDVNIQDAMFTWCSVGKLVANKGYDRMLRIQKRLVSQGYQVQFWVLGTGPQEQELIHWCKKNEILDSVVFWGYQTNPYKYVAKCDLYVCASHAEGFSTAATEALIVGTPVCTVEVSGMKEMLGENNEYGLVTENNEEALYQGIKSLFDNPEQMEYYKTQAIERGKAFSTENTVAAVERMLDKLLEGN